MKEPKQRFGGEWTSAKLERIRKYLIAYATIMRRQNFRFAYIDAFAGTGYNAPKTKKDQGESFFPESAEPDVLDFIDGSARIALKVEPRFTKYIFVEKDPRRFAELAKLKDEFPSLASDIVLVNAEANAYLQDLCINRRWEQNRAVLFLDPFGMQVGWNTIEAIAKTQAIDLWILFPLGIGVNRLLRRDAKISEAWQKRLDNFFGTSDWREAFYQQGPNRVFLGPSLKPRKLLILALLQISSSTGWKLFFQELQKTHSLSKILPIRHFICYALLPATSAEPKQR
jgi:three-Cys-motif partner protein